jgi:putative membrane protein
VDGCLTALLAGLVLGVVNALLKPLLVVLTLPITVLTLGLFLLVINALLLWLAAAIVPGFRVRGFGPALLGALLLSIFSFGLTLVV